MQISRSRWNRAITDVGADDREAFLAHLLRLDRQTRLERFCHPAGDAQVRDYVDRIDFAEGRVLGCSVAGRLRGAAELRRSGSARSGVCEATFSVERDWQGRGIGRALLLHVIPLAREIGARLLLVDRLAGCCRMLHLLGQFDSRIFFEHDDCKAWLPLAETARDRTFWSPPALQGS